MNERESLNNYLDCEQLLNNLFAKLGTCSERAGDGICSCCNKDIPANYHSKHVNPLLNSERETIFGFGNKSNDSCPYLGSDGCALDSHKPPICVAYACNNLLAALADQGINYNYLAVESKLLNVLSGISDGSDLKKMINEWFRNII
ncbi:MAG: hypothetical protein WC307_05825 [Candidatus Nanoarchaeia archaeon]|jgi:hypothetical protein